MHTSKIKIYDIDYIMNAELTDDDLHYLLDLHSFKYSLIIAMFKLVTNKYKDDIDIINICKSNKNWFNKYRFTERQFKDFLNIVKLSYKNLYRYNDFKCRQLAEWWMTVYGFQHK
jgi:hypothetical protein